MGVESSSFKEGGIWFGPFSFQALIKLRGPVMGGRLTSHELYDFGCEIEEVFGLVFISRPDSMYGL